MRILGKLKKTFLVFFAALFILAALPLYLPDFYDVKAAGSTVDLATSTNFNVRFDGAAEDDYLSEYGTDLIDVNDNGLDDVVLMTPFGDNNTRNNSGSIYMIYDSLLDDFTGTGNTVDLATSTNWNIRIDGASALARLGYGHVKFFDIDGDNKKDLILPAARETVGGQVDAGAVYIVLGDRLDDFVGTGNTLDLATSTNYYLRIEGSTFCGGGVPGSVLGDVAGGGRLGYYSMDVGDYDDDNISDLVLGAPFCDIGDLNTNQGAVYLIPGSRLDDFSGTGNTMSVETSTNWSHVFVGTDQDDEIGWRSTSVIDINEDGIDDVVFGNFDGMMITLSTLLDDFPGTGNELLTNGTGTADSWSYKFETSGSSYWGKNENIFADFDDNGSLDLAVGSHVTNSNGTAAGAVYIYFDINDSGGLVDGEEGPAVAINPFTRYDLRIAGAAEQDRLRTTIPNYRNNNGDLTGDGKRDLVLVANLADNNSRSASGSVYVIDNNIFAGYKGSTNARITLGDSSNYTVRYDGAAAGDHLGMWNTTVSDINSDGINDLIMGARNSDFNSRSESGSAYIIYGAAESAGSQSCPSNVRSYFHIGDLGRVESGSYAVDLLNNTNTQNYFKYSAYINGDTNRPFDGEITLTKPDLSELVSSTADEAHVGGEATGTYTIEARSLDDTLCDSTTITVEANPTAGTIDPPTGITATTVGGGTDVTVTPSVATEDLYVRDNAGDIVAQIQVDLTTGRDWRAMVVTKDDAPSESTVNGKAVLHFPGGASAIPGNTNSDFILYVERDADDDFVRICPGAESLTDVTRTCANGVNLDVGTNGQYTVTQDTIESRDVWVIDGVTGTGGISVDTAGGVDLTLTPNEMATDSSQLVCASYLPTNGEFVAAEEIRFSFTPALAGAPSSTDLDADDDTTNDGSFTTLSTTQAIYTFSGSTTQSNVTGIDLCLTFPSSLSQASYSVSFSDSGGAFGAALLHVGDDNDVTVTLEVIPTLSFNIRSLDDSTDTNTCDLGTIDTSTTPNTDTTDDGAGECGYGLAIGTNATGGFQVQITSDGDLDNASSSILNAAEDDSIAAGTEAYGLVNITAAQSGRNGGTGDYDQSITEDGTFGDDADFTPVPQTPTNFVSYTDGIQYASGTDATDLTTVMHGMTVGAGTPAGLYQQIVTYTVTVTF